MFSNLFIDCAQLLIEKGANYNLQDSDHVSAKQLAYNNKLFNQLDFVFENRQGIFITIKHQQILPFLIFIAEIMEAYRQLYYQSEKLKEEKSQMQAEIIHLKGFLQQVCSFLRFM